MNPNLAELLKKDNTIAVVGASRDRAKYGYRVFHTLKEEGFKVFPVNPNAREVDGVKAYPSLKELPQKPALVIVVVPPKVAKKIVEEAAAEGIENLWFQPGSESEEVLNTCREMGLNCIAGLCYIKDALKIEFRI